MSLWDFGVALRESRHSRTRPLQGKTRILKRGLSYEAVLTFV